MYLSRNGVSDWNLSAGDFDEFRRGLDPLAQAGRLAAVLAQFPPSFHAGPETRDYLTWLLSGLADYPCAVELRHRTWSDDAQATAGLLAAHGAGWVLIDEPKFRDSIDQGGASVQGFRGSEVQTVRGSEIQGIRNAEAETSEPRTPEPRNLGTPEPATVAPLYVRLHGRNAAAWWNHAETEDRYDYLYSPAELRPFAAIARDAAASGRRVLMYLNNHFSAKSVANAAILKHELGQRVPGEYPRDIVDRYPELAGVVMTSGLPL
jgi:uncharacterized protein YecE (DUF72 family)